MKFSLNAKIKKILWGIFAVVLVVVCGIWFLLSPSPEHIEDTNGADNYALQTITEQDVIAFDMGTKGAISESEINFDFGGLGVSNGTKYSSEKFTGVYLLNTCQIFKGSDIYVHLAEYDIKEGNFAFYVVFDGEVIGQVEPDEFGMAEFLLEDVDKNGTLEYIIAGESANFTFTAPIGW